MLRIVPNLSTNGVLAYSMLQDQTDKLADIDDPELGRAVMLAIEFLEELRG